MNYQEWISTVPEEIRQDPLWNLEVYRLSLFVADMSWDDTEHLDKNSHARGAADQIRRSLDSISANIAERYSRYANTYPLIHFPLSVPHHEPQNPPHHSNLHHHIM